MYIVTCVSIVDVPVISISFDAPDGSSIVPLLVEYHTVYVVLESQSANGDHLGPLYSNINGKTLKSHL